MLPKRAISMKASSVAGCMAGLAAGDALGAPVERRTAESLRQEFPQGVRDFVARADLGLAAGQVTDDTEMAFVVAYSLLARHGLDMADVASRLIQWADRTNCTVGSSTRGGIEAIRAGIHWSCAGSMGSPSSGCLPRCIPVAMLLPAASVAQATIECCQATHRHPQALACTVALNLLLSELVAGTQWEDCLAALLSPDSQWPGSADAKPALLTLLEGERESDGAAGVLAEAIRAVRQSGSAEEAIVAAVMAGGDTDTCGAVAGALAGARWGLDSIPQRWLGGCDAAREAIRIGQLLAEIR